jgi:hypothetical protein
MRGSTAQQQVTAIMSSQPKHQPRSINTQLEPPKSFLHDQTPVDNTRVREGESEPDGHRDSHDLSLANVTRDSVVDNMLLSLDQFPVAATNPTSFTNYAALYSNFNDDNLFGSDGPYISAAPPPRQGRHTHHSSYSSEYDWPPDDASSRYSGHLSRGRRSNSSSNFQNLHRGESFRASFKATRVNSDGTAKARLGETSGKPTHNRGTPKNGSKASGSSSVDFGYSQALPPPVRPGHISRSASFDHSYDKRARTSPLKLNTAAASQSVVYTDYDAAPTPTIPAGPRRYQEAHPASPIYHIAQPNFPPPPIPTRRNSIRSATSRTSKKSKNQAPTPDDSIRAQANDFFNAHASHDRPPATPYADPPAPSPTVALRKLSGGSPNQPSKEKPGFFRRVFGSFASNAKEAPNSDNTRAISSGQESRTTSQRPKSTQTNKSLPRTPAEQRATTSSSDIPHQQAQPTITKKHSSFFRRRKKSISEVARPLPPPLPLQVQQTKAEDFLPAQSSPSISSLRKVMNPYLAGPVDMNAENHESTYLNLKDAENYQTAFSPDYFPHQDATVRSVRADIYTEQSIGTSNEIPSDSPKLKLKVKRGRMNETMVPPDTFLADSSGNEDKPSRTLRGRNDDKRPKTSPSSPSFLHHQISTADPIAPVLEKAKEPQSTHLVPFPPNSQQIHSSEGEDESWYNDSRATQQPNLGPGWLEPTSSNENVGDNEKPAALADDAPDKMSPITDEFSPTSDAYHSATSLPIVQVDSEDAGNTNPELDTPTEEYERAKMIFDGDETFVTKARAAAYLGDDSRTGETIRVAYMDLFDWTNMNILASLRDLCSRLVLKAETQQLDRVLSSFAQRWCDCNPNHGFKSKGITSPQFHFD